MTTSWKDFAPCRGQDPRRFDAPKYNDRAAWERARATAEQFCRACPFLRTTCVSDPASHEGLWAGSVRTSTTRGFSWEPLIPNAPVPNLPAERPTFAPWLPTFRRAS